MPSQNKSQGFTLIEALLVVVIISILSGVIYAVIDPVGLSEKTTVAARAENLRQLANALEAYTAGEGSVPVDSDNNNSLQEELQTSPTLANYLAKWPDDTNSTYTYKTFTAGATLGFVVMVNQDDNSTGHLYLKYFSTSPDPAYPSCGKIILRDCSDQLAGVDDCRFLDKPESCTW